jgi:hypothetical protein
VFTTIQAEYQSKTAKINCAILIYFFLAKGILKIQKIPKARGKTHNQTIPYFI